LFFTRLVGSVIPDVVLNSVGVVDMDACDINLTRKDLLDRLSCDPEITRFGIRPGDYLNQWDFKTILRTHPTCYPYGFGAPPENIHLKEYFHWAMRYADSRFCRYVFSITDVDPEDSLYEGMFTAQCANIQAIRNLANSPSLDVEGILLEDTIRKIQISQKMFQDVCCSSHC
jgi:hypothetical protein